MTKRKIFGYDSTAKYHRHMNKKCIDVLKKIFGHDSTAKYHRHMNKKCIDVLKKIFGDDSTTKYHRHMNKSLLTCSKLFRVPRLNALIVQELCESRGGRPGLSVLTSLLVSVDVKLY